MIDPLADYAAKILISGANSGAKLLIAFYLFTHTLFCLFYKPLETAGASKLFAPESKWLSQFPALLVSEALWRTGQTLLRESCHFYTCPSTTSLYATAMNAG